MMWIAVRQALCAGALASVAQAQQPSSALPPTQPTLLSQPVNASQGSASEASSGVTSPASVTWASDRLTVVSHGSRLNTLLTQIGSETGLKVSGSAGTEPIYGSYGPDSLENVVTALFAGLPINLLLLRDGSTSSLLLTSRVGGVSPPNPAAAQADPDLEDLQRSATPAVTPQVPSGQQQQQRDINGGVNGGINGGQLPPSPNGVRTPGEIFQQLQQQRGMPTQPPRQ